MKICIVSTYFQPTPLESYGGIEIEVQHMAAGLAAAGHEVTVLACGSSAGQRTIECDGVEYRQLCLGTVFRPNARAVVAGIREFSRRVRVEIAGLDADLVHYHTRFPLFLNARWHARQHRRVPIVYHAHIWRPGDRMRFPVFSRRAVGDAAGRVVDRRIANHCDLVFAVSEFMRERVIESAGVDPDHVVVIPNVIDTETFSPASSTCDAPCIVFVGRMAHEKGVLLLIEAMAQVVREIPEATLRIVGPVRQGTEFGAYTAQCIRRVEALQLGEHVEFVGETPNPELPEVMRGGRLVAVPSVWDEAFGLVAIEGMACGRPVVASRTGALPELIDDGRTGRIVEPDDVEAWGRALVEVLRDDTLAETALIEGPKLVQTRYDCKSAGDRLATAYARLIAENAICSS
jgi:glycosyltransferase involved in cell wall biosynthesis